MTQADGSFFSGNSDVTGTRFVNFSTTGDFRMPPVAPNAAKEKHFSAGMIPIKCSVEACDHNRLIL